MLGVPVPGPMVPVTVASAWWLPGTRRVPPDCSENSSTHHAVWIPTGSLKSGIDGPQMLVSLWRFWAAHPGSRWAELLLDRVQSSPSSPSTMANTVGCIATSRKARCLHTRQAPLSSSPGFSPVTSHPRQSTSDQERTGLQFGMCSLGTCGRPIESNVRPLMLHECQISHHQDCAAEMPRGQRRAAAETSHRALLCSPASAALRGGAPCNGRRSTVGRSEVAELSTR